MPLERAFSLDLTLDKQRWLKLVNRDGDLAPCLDSQRVILHTTHNFPIKDSSTQPPFVPLLNKF